MEPGVHSTPVWGLLALKKKNTRVTELSFLPVAIKLP